MDNRFFESGASRYVSPIAGELAKTLKGGTAGGANASGGKLFYLRVCNTTAAAIFVLTFDGDNTNPILMAPIQVPANGQTELKLPGPIPFNNGLTISASTSQTSRVDAGANSLQIDAVFK